MVRNAVKDSRLHRNSKMDLVVVTKRKVIAAFVTVQGANTICLSSPEPFEIRECEATLSVPIVRKHPKSEKSSERRHTKKSCSKENAPPYVFQIPELHINARPYVEIEAEEARATAITCA